MHSSAAPASCYSQAECAARWTSLLASETGDLRRELLIELSEYFGAPIGEIEARMADATVGSRRNGAIESPIRQTALGGPVLQRVGDQLFDLAGWHAEDPIHFRTLVCADIAAPSRPDVLDYGSASVPTLVFAAAGSTSPWPMSRARCSRSPNGAASDAAFRSMRSI